MKRVGYISRISTEEAEAAYFASTVKEQRQRIAARIAEEIAARHAGTYINAASAQKILDGLPSSLTYKAALITYNRERREIWIHWPAASYNEDSTITLADRETRRVNAEELQKAAAARRAKADEIRDARETFFGAVQQFNTVAAALETLTKQLDPVMFSLPRGW